MTGTTNNRKRQHVRAQPSAGKPVDFSLENCQPQSGGGESDDSAPIFIPREDEYCNRRNYFPEPKEKYPIGGHFYAKSATSNQEILNLVESISTSYNINGGDIIRATLSIVKRCVKWLMSDGKDKDELREILNDLLHQAEIVAGEVCPQHVERLREVRGVIAHRRDMAAANAAAEPPAPPPLPTTPRVRFADRSGHPELANLNIVEFLRAEYGAWLDGSLSRRQLRRLDPQAEMALANWLRSHDLPADVQIPTKKQENDDILRSTGLAIDDVLRAGRMLEGRRRRAASAPSHG